MRLDQQDEGPVTRAEQIAAKIAARRKAAGDDNLEALSLDAFGAVRYVISHTTGVSRPVVAADVLDTLRVVRELRDALDRQELGLMRIGRKRSVTWQQMADALGLGSRQAAEQRRQRLEAGVAGDGRNEVAARASSKARTDEARWFADNRTSIEQLAGILALTSFRSPAAQDDAESLADLLADDEPFTGQLLTWISQILDELARTGEVLPGLHSVLEDAGHLVSKWCQVRTPIRDPAIPA